MGIKNYFKPKAAKGQPAPEPVPQMSEKPPVLAGNSMEMSATGTPRNMSSRASIAPSTRSSYYVDEIKHEVMVNYLHQQQCSHMWVDDMRSGEREGVLLRKSRNNYLACPPDLVHSHLAMAIGQLNCQVSIVVFSNLTMKLIPRRSP